MATAQAQPAGALSGQPDEWISTADAAELCRVSENTMKAWVRDDLVRAVTDGDGGWLVHRPTMEAWLRRAAHELPGA